MKLPPYSDRAVAAGVGIWAAFACLLAALAALIFIPVRSDLPPYAMDSVLVFQLERAVVIAAALILPALVIGPLLSGVLPRKLSSDGIDWGDDRANVVDALGAMNQRLDALEDSLKGIADLNNA